MPIRITYEHPPGSGEVGCRRTFADDHLLDSTRGRIRADAVQVDDCLRTTPRFMTKVVAVEAVVE